MAWSMPALPAGDQAPVGAPLVVMLVGERPMRASTCRAAAAGQVGQAAQIQLEGAVPYCRARARDPQRAFVHPYYALTGDDVERLSYLAEIQVDAAADIQALPAGVPVQVRF